MDFAFTIFPIFFGIVFCFVFGTIIYNLVKSAAEGRKNAASPRIVAPATLVAKRYMHHRRGGMYSADSMNTLHSASTYTTYFITFEFESGDRMEFAVPDEVFGLSVEGDRGRLTFQGTKYLDFTRE